MSERSLLCESEEEELANMVSHAIGALLSVVGLVVMLWFAVPLGIWHTVGVSVFGASLILLYTASTFYHRVTAPGKKRVFQILDHALIFVLIAGSYTPWLIVNLRGPWGWSLFGAVWGIALVGTILKVIFLPRLERAGKVSHVILADRIGSGLYIAMGWIIVIAIKPLLASVGSTGMFWLVAGGLCYTGGVAFFLMRKLKYSHLIWHLFVMSGSACHVVAVIYGVLRPQ